MQFYSLNLESKHLLYDFNIHFREYIHCNISGMEVAINENE